MKDGWLRVGEVGLEPTTPVLSGPCSDQLSYSPSKLAHQALLLDAGSYSTTSSTGVLRATISSMGSVVLVFTGW